MSSEPAYSPWDRYPAHWDPNVVKTVQCTREKYPSMFDGWMRYQWRDYSLGIPPAFFDECARLEAALKSRGFRIEKNG